MPRIVVRAPRELEAGFARIRQQLGVPEDFPPEVTAEAVAAQPDPGPDHRLDARDLPLVTIDPAGSRDLDQALALARRGDGYRVSYAIADVAAFVRPGGAIDTEARARGTTLYCPDKRAPLHPPELSEGRASLLPGEDRPALLWTIDLDAAGLPTSGRLERALVRSRAALSYPEAQAAISAGRADPGGSLLLLAEIGRLRQEREAERGGISLNLPAQKVERTDDGYELGFERPLPVEDWNAQISLLAGIVAGHTMVEARVGVLRTLPPPFPDAIERLRHTAQALGLTWPAAGSYAAFVRSVDTATPAGNAFVLQAAHTLRGAGYAGFNGTVPEHPTHGAIASVYAHVTAPLRRLVDRFGNEILLALYAGVTPPAWATEALAGLPALMGHAGQRESALERALLDYVEAVALASSVGQTFHGVVVDVDQHRDRAQVQIAEPAVVATVAAHDDGHAALELAEAVDLKLTAVDPDTRTVTFETLAR